MPSVVPNTRALATAEDRLVVSDVFELELGLLDPGIAPIVKALRAEGVDTFSSCDELTNQGVP